MKNNHISQQKLILDERLLETLKKLGLVSSKTGFSQLCGKNDSYFDCMRSRGYGIHIGSLVLISARLADRLNSEQDVRERAKLRSALEAVHETIQEKCRLRELELLS